jgi:hypothetical protein
MEDAGPDPVEPSTSRPPTREHRRPAAETDHDSMPERLLAFPSSVVLAGWVNIVPART